MIETSASKFMDLVLPDATCIHFFPRVSIEAGQGSLVGCVSACYADSREFDPHVRQHSLVEIGRQIISGAILSLLLIQEGQLSVTGERMCAKYWTKLPRRLAQKQCG